jgi:GTP-binding protein
MSRHHTAPSGRVALVGRPNVGKSTIFNRLTGTRRAIVTSVAGTTRDVLARPVEWQQTVFTLVDTGGVVGASDDPMWEAVASRGRRAAAEVDVVVFVVDGRAGPIPADDEVAREIRVRGVPVVLAINKMDDRRARDRVLEFHRFGFESIVEIAAEHGQGIGDLLDAVVARLPAVSVNAPSMAEEPEATAEPAIAVVGRPNVGKSSLVNRLLREDRVLVSPTPGTTRDVVEEVMRWHRRQFRIVDTAGLRRPGRVAESGKVESVSVVRARHAMEQADVAVLVVDAAAGVGRRDASIAGEAAGTGCGLIIAANKWDLVKGRGPDFAKDFDGRLRDALKFAEYAPIVHLSALTGERTERLLERIAEVDAARRQEVATGELNRVLGRATRTQAPSGVGHGSVQIRYGVQTGVAPPIFTLFTSRGARLHFSYERFIQNQLREAFGFTGTPIRLKVRGR